MQIEVAIEEVFKRDGATVVSCGYLASWSVRGSVIVAREPVRDDHGRIMLFANREAAKGAAEAAANDTLGVKAPGADQRGTPA